MGKEVGVAVAESVSRVAEVEGEEGVPMGHTSPQTRADTEHTPLIHSQYNTRLHKPSVMCHNLCGPWVTRLHAQRHGVLFQ